MNPLKIKDNQLKLKTDFADVKAITDVIADKTFEQLEKDGIFVFPEIIKDADDISRNQMVLQSYNDMYATGNVMGFLGAGNQRLVIESRFSTGEDYLFQYLLNRVMDFPNVVDLEADANQDNAADKSEVELADALEINAKVKTDNRQQKRHCGDNQCRHNQCVLHQSQIDTHHKRVNTGGDGKLKQCLDSGNIKRPILLARERLTNHSSADERQQTESHPMVECLNKMSDTATCEPPDNRHKPLETTEENGHNQHRAKTRALNGHTRGHRHRKAVHCQRNGNDENIENAHIRKFCRKYMQFELQVFDARD